MKTMAGLALALMLASPIFAETPAPFEMIVKDPVADIRAKPEAGSREYVHDPLQETQVTEGEVVRVLERRGGWARVECVQQAEYTHTSKWEGYPGWIKWKSLTADISKKKILPEIEKDETLLRKKVLDYAFRHQGESYLWGGRSLHNPKYKKTVTGVDCSGLVNLAFLEAGVIVPRDAHEQYMKARRIEPLEAKPGDLIFLAKADNPEKVVHVAFYIGNNEIFEAPQTGEKVRKITMMERFGGPVETMKNGMIIKDRLIYFGTLFPVQQP